MRVSNRARAALTLFGGATLLALVALTASVLGVGSYLFVDFTLHGRVRDDAAAQARFDLSVLIPDRLPPEPTIDDLIADHPVFASSIIAALVARLRTTSAHLEST